MKKILSLCLTALMLVQMLSVSVFAAGNMNDSELDWGCIHVSDSHPCVDGHCVECGSEVAATAAHTVSGACDTVCNVCGNAVEATADHSYHFDCDKNCAVCGEETRPAATHEYFNDCDPVCLICNEATRVADHFVVHAAAVDPTCAVEGNIEYWYCNVCGAAWLDEARTQNTNLKSVVLPATGAHTYDNACDSDCNVCYDQRDTQHTPGDPADCVNPQICTVCGGQLAPQLGHKWTAATCTDPKTCSVCGATEGTALGHTPGAEADCNYNQICTVCKVELAPALGHIYDNACDGECNRCGGYRKPADHVYDNACDAFCNVCDAQRIVGSHRYTNACDPDCDICGDVREISGHPYEPSVTTQPTCRVPGVMTYICRICGDYYFEDIPATGEHTYTYACDTTCAVCGWITNPGAKHEYFNDCDAVCLICNQETREEGHNVIHVEAMAPTCAVEGNIEHWYCDVCGGAWLDEARTQNTNLKSVVLPATGEHTYTFDCDKNCAVCGNETRPAAAHEYFNDCDAVCLICNRETREEGHNVLHAAAVAPTCAVEGNIEYWYCDACGGAWLDEARTQNTNVRAVKLPATGEHTYNFDCDKNCAVCGNETRPAAAHEYFNDCDAVCLICNRETREEGHNVLHAAALAPTCTVAGNIEYWYCDACGAAWLDEARTQNTNVRAVKLPATGEHIYENACDADCDSCGATREVGDHVYDDDEDPTCNECGYIREIQPPEVENIPGDVNGDGKINNVDLVLVIRYFSGWKVQIDLNAADVDNDGKFGVKDIALLQQYLNGWAVELI